MYLIGSPGLLTVAGRLNHIGLSGYLCFPLILLGMLPWGVTQFIVSVLYLGV